MWFGNLVTMDWWNDLWLNESFADFICYIAMFKINLKTTLDNPCIAWNNRKAWGYGADTLPTTHPIAGPVKDTAAAETIFDGITYSKGAASMRQLMFRVGEDTFSKAMSRYFNKYAWGNTVLDNLLDEMKAAVADDYSEEERAQGGMLDIDNWKQEWLETAGLNSVLPEWNPEDQSKEAEMTIV
jgi:aminopeptidase N